MPKALFGEDTEELEAFNQAALIVAPGAWELLQELLASWQAGALEHAWTLPDGYRAKVKVMKKKTARVEVDELDHSTFTYEFYDNEGTEKGLSNVANVTHSMDAYVLRSMHRRCNYDPGQANYARTCIEMELIHRNIYGEPSQAAIDEFMTDKLKYYIELYERSTLADIVILPYLDEDTVTCLSTEHLQKIQGILNGMLQYKPFELVTVHDEFKAHPNNLNWVRWQYREIMAEIAEADVLNFLYEQIAGPGVQLHKLSFNLGDQIRKSQYALC